MLHFLVGEKTKHKLRASLTFGSALAPRRSKQVISLIYWSVGESQKTEIIQNEGEHNKSTKIKNKYEIKINDSFKQKTNKETKLKDKNKHKK